MPKTTEDLLLVEALADYRWRRQDERPERATRAWVLDREIAVSHGLSFVDALSQRGFAVARTVSFVLETVVFGRLTSRVESEFSLSNGIAICDI